MSVQAIVGSRAVFLAFDLDVGDRDQCLGFAIHRVDHDANPPEQYWLLSFKTFQSVVPNPVASQRYSTFDHPIQSFYWGDYTVRPGAHYTYRVVPRYGQAKNLTSKPGVEVSLDVTTQDPDAGVHGVYFNRGVAASQAYATKFVQPPDQLAPADRDQAMVWLSRGLHEAIVAFIGQANSSQWALRAAVYEFTEPGVLGAFKAAHDQGADVQIVYHAKADSTGTGNRAAITAAGLPASMLIERTNTTIAHNKYIVLCAKNPAGDLEARAVWTGSTNLSEGGIFGHSNVGHAVRDPAIAAQYLDHWRQLQPDPDTATLKTWIDQHSPFDPTALTQPGIHTAFSPRTGTKLLGWYGTRNASAPVVSNITLAFGMTKDLETPLEADTTGGIRYVMLDKADNNQAAWDNRPQVLTAVGASGGPDALTRWAKEVLTGFNPLVKYLHTKILLLDPISANPTVISGSANFSPASTSANDENMLIINGDVDLADLYLTEYARIFQHFYARYWAAQLNTTPASATTASFLNETPDWQTPYYQPNNPKSLVRQLFTTQVQANT
jgi:phosphatidylserine/phosphatidylglycerophosphate/cardiolipin synthase-like enzyme